MSQFVATGKDLNSKKTLSVDEFGFLSKVPSQSMRVCILSVDSIDVSRHITYQRLLVAHHHAVLCSNHYVARVLWKVLRMRVHRGNVPSELRGRIWCALMSPQPVVELKEDQEDVDSLDRLQLSLLQNDLHRTFPSHILFQGRSSVGQEALVRTLTKYMQIKNSIDYCQGMGLIVSVLLTQLNPTDALKIFCTLMHNPKWNLSSMYANGFSDLRIKYYQLKRCLEMFLPQLHNHFVNEGIDVTMFASQWFLTLFAHQFPFPFVLRIWDIFICEGWVFIFQVALTLLQKEQHILLTLPLDGLLVRIKHLCRGKDSEDVIALALDVPLCIQTLDRFRNEILACPLYLNK